MFYSLLVMVASAPKKILDVDIMVDTMVPSLWR